jgi:hypothetical protein
MSNLQNRPLWGLVTTTNDSFEKIIRFIAYHLDAGASWIRIYLDDPSITFLETLKLIKNVEPILCDENYWASYKHGRPETHQRRQSENANHAYKVAPVDWLGHIDVDEFLSPNVIFSDILYKLPIKIKTISVKSAEYLNPFGDIRIPGDLYYFKNSKKNKNHFSTINQLYPTFGSALRRGFVGHMQGKVFARTKVPLLRYRIHRCIVNGEYNPNNVILKKIELCHFHCENWEDWRGHLKFRMAKGAYKNGNGRTLERHELFSFLLSEGEDVLRQFYDEICVARPELLEALRERGMLSEYDLGLKRKTNAMLKALL